MDVNSTSPGEIGGIFAGIVTVLGVLGGGIRWFLGWKERQEQSRALKLQAWHDQLQAREAKLDAERDEYQQRIERRLAQMETEHNALRGAYHLIASALRTIDPTNQALTMADKLLSVAFPLDAAVPADMTRLLNRLD